jgi:predicted flap endonuclease-1-like 5' DNA nuclease
VNGLTLVALIVLAIGIGVAWRAGAMHKPPPRLRLRRRAAALGAIRVLGQPGDAHARRSARAPEATPARDLPSLQLAASAERAQLLAFAEDRRRLYGELADARSETARYRQIVVDIERNAPPPLLDAPGTPDDLKLIVGVGPVIERMLYQMGIASYRQIARWSERDIDDVDARLREFPGRVRRDGWVTQARALHVGKYGTAP